ncbi:MAG: hypothetical protein WDN09_01345 [bacterium]
MKSSIYSVIAAIVIVTLTSCGAARRTTVSGTQDESNNRTTTNGINTRTGGTATNQITITELPNGNVVTLIPLYKGARLQGWIYTMTNRNGEVVDGNNGKRHKYQTAQEAYDGWYNNYYGSGNYGRNRGVAGNVLGAVIRNVAYGAAGYGQVRVYHY